MQVENKQLILILEIASEKALREENKRRMNE